MAREARNGTGKQGYEDRITGDREILENTSPVSLDTDQDGVPDDCERMYNLDPNNAEDAVKLAKDGYTALEHDCHHLAARRIENAIALHPPRQP